MRHLLLILLLVTAKAAAGPPDTSFVPGALYDAHIPPPDSVLGCALGSRPARYGEIVAYLNVLAQRSDRVQLTTTGTTHEGRAEYLLVISSKENRHRLEEIRRDIGRLADPRTLPSSEAEALLRRLPAIVWIGYGIHGDELSSGDAALQVAYHLAAGIDTGTTRILREAVVCIDPMQNPDGRERFLGQMQQWGGNVPNGDIQSLHHTGTWPQGRGNHYLFDLNRDWFALVHPETRGRVRTLLEWNPQVVIDSHEMGSYDTYLFSPPREPINPNIDQHARKWWGIFAADQARAFDRYGWSYYTREWNDEWYPGYGASWCIYAGGIGILYEQAGVEGSFVKRPDGTTLTYREAVHHHTVSSLANLGTAAAHREELLRDYVALRRSASERREGEPEVFYILPGDNPARGARFAETLTLQGINVRVADRDFSAADLTDRWGAKHRSRTLPSGTIIVALDQGLGRLAKAILEFDPRLKTEVVNEERKQLEREGHSRMYDITAWSLPIAYGLEAYSSTSPARVPASAFVPAPPAPGGVTGPAGAYGYMLDYRDDLSVVALARMLEAGLRVRVANDTGTVDGRPFKRGSILLRGSENPASLRKMLEEICASTGARARAVTTALAGRGVDLGGNDFILLEEPRIALVGGPETSSTSFGALWHLLDARLRMRHTLLAAPFMAFGDLRKYNVLVLPDGGEAAYRRLLGKEGIGRLRQWVEGGGTLIAIGGAATYIADSATGLTSVRLRHQALRELEQYTTAQRQEEGALAPRIDSVALWSGSLKPDTSSASKQGVDEKLLAREDERGRLFSPQGAIMKIVPDPEHWLCYGVAGALGAVMSGSSAYLSRRPVSTAARFAGPSEIRVAGLLWPEARERWAHTAYLVSERRGNGQLILFADDPAFRGFFLGTERLLLNAMLLGPGCGARAAAPW